MFKDDFGEDLGTALFEARKEIEHLRAQLYRTSQPTKLDGTKHVCEFPEDLSKLGFPEIFRLARLGLWAEEHGIELAKRSHAYHDGGGNDDWHYCHDNSAKAVAALPEKK